jgi:phosphoribosylaminoimidazolecarboxamide formyltransferase / IMP cyclohydrolase
MESAKAVKRKALISVSNKTGVVEFAKGLIERGFEIYSTGNTKNTLTDAGVAVQSVSDLTGFPEILDGRVKTLHPAVHGGILARRDKPAHLEELAQQNISPIDLVAVNLYPFAETVSKPGVTQDDALENIDIGGPTMVRAAAKNFPSVLVVVDPADYDAVLAALSDGSANIEMRQKLAAKAFQHTASYDTMIAGFLRTPAEHFPNELTLSLTKVQDLRYGENPHQIAAFYEWRATPTQKFVGMANAKQIQGKELSYNNILDADAALAVVRDFSAPTVAIIKHTNPCGLASNQDLAVAYDMALAGDPISAYGGIVAVNRAVDTRLAERIVSSFYEVIIAPDFTPPALELFKKKKSLRLLAVGELAHGADQLAMALDYREVAGGFLAQTRDALAETDLSMQVMTTRHPNLEEVTNLQFAWRAVKHIKSNAIVLVKNHAIVGMGAGQPSRVDSVKIALNKAGIRAKGSVLASDAFFPKPDGAEAAAVGGVTAIIQPGGSISDTDVLEVAARYNLAMVFTGRRHFKH